MFLASFRDYVALHNGGLWSALHLAARAAREEERLLTKNHVTVKAVEAANAKMQVSRVHGYERPQPIGLHVVKPASPSRAAIAEAGQRALQSFKK